jgi:response regulator RpfG family c-di-GMP phosphodiesterase
MPGMTGFEFISKVKAMAPNKICMILSAFSNTEFKDNLTAEKNIFRFLNKPWRRPEMNQTILEAIDSYKSLQKT